MERKKLYCIYGKLIVIRIAVHFIFEERHLKISPLRSNVAYLQRETFSFMMSHPAMSLRDRLCASRKGGAGGGGWVHPKGANSMAAFGLSFERPLVGAG